MAYSTRSPAPSIAGEPPKDEPTAAARWVRLIWDKPLCRSSCTIFNTHARCGQVGEDASVFTAATYTTNQSARGGRIEAALALMHAQQAPQCRPYQRCHSFERAPEGGEALLGRHNRVEFGTRQGLAAVPEAPRQLLHCGRTAPKLSMRRPHVVWNGQKRGDNVPFSRRLSSRSHTSRRRPSRFVSSRLRSMVPRNPPCPASKLRALRVRVLTRLEAHELLCTLAASGAQAPRLAA
eukprot:scaffold624_cov402-Prasinococcus_capsulatus_cf.AAC.69